MALGTPVVGAAAYSASGGTSVAPAYPTGILATDAVLLVVGQKPSTANGGTVTTPTGWTLREEITGAGGYGTTLGADTGNTNLRIYSWNTPVAGQTGTLSVTLGTNNISWAFIVRVPTGGGTLSYGSADGQRTTTPTSPMSIALTNGASATNFEAGDLAIWAMCIPTDVTTPSQFSAQSITATGATFATAVEMNEPDSATGNDIGGYSARALVTAGSSTTAPTVAVTLAGTLTNVRGPVALVRIREAGLSPITGTFSATETGTDTFTASGSVTDPPISGTMVTSETGLDVFAGLGNVVIIGSVVTSETGDDLFDCQGTVTFNTTVGDLHATEAGDDSFSSTGNVIVSGALNATELNDAFEAVGKVLVSGSASASETDLDLFDSQGAVLPDDTVGDLHVTEVGDDLFASSGQLIISGALSVSEVGQDSFLASGAVVDSTVNGSMSVSEASNDAFIASGFRKAEDYLPGYWENRWDRVKKKEESVPEVVNYDEDVAAILLLVA